MADVMPDYQLSTQMLRWKLAEQRLSLEKSRVVILEMADRSRRNLVNVEAAKLELDRLIALLATDDKTPLDKQRLRLQIAGQKATIERQLLENMEGAERAVKQDEVMEASIRTIGEMEKQLKGLEETHGVLDESTFMAIRKSIDQAAEI